MSPSLKFYAYLHSSAIATLLCTLLITACSDPVRDAIKSAEKFAAAQDYDEALRVLDTTPFKTPEEKARIADAHGRIERAQKAVYIDKVLKSVEYEATVPLVGAFHGLAMQEPYFTQGLLLRYSKQVMRYNMPVEACEEQKRQQQDLYRLCNVPMRYMSAAALADVMASRMKAHAEHGNVTATHCIRYFTMRSLFPAIPDQAVRQAIGAQMVQVSEALRTKLKVTTDEFYEQAKAVRGECTPEVVFGEV